MLLQERRLNVLFITLTDLGGYYIFSRLILVGV